jgi:small subunit ribosomal protein S7
MLRCVTHQAFEKIKRIQLQRYHSTEEPEKKASIYTDPLKIFHAALSNSKPVLQLTPIKRGGVTYQVGCF